MFTGDLPVEAAACVPSSIEDFMETTTTEAIIYSSKFAQLNSF